MAAENQPGAGRGARSAGLPSAVRTALAAVTAVCIFAMAVLTFVDVIGRYFLNAPIPGTFEIVGLILGLGMFAAFPLVTFRETHITVDLFDHFIRGRARRARRVAVRLATAAMAAFMAERLYAAAVDEWASDFVTQYFGISRTPLLLVMAALCALTAIGMLAITLRGGETGPPDPGDPGDSREAAGGGRADPC